MDLNPSSFPILSYVMDRLSIVGSKSAIDDISDLESIQIDDGQPQLIKPQQPSSSSSGLFNQMPHLSDPKVIAAMTRAVSGVAQTRSVLNALGDRPDHEAVDTAKASSPNQTINGDPHSPSSPPPKSPPNGERKVRT